MLRYNEADGDRAITAVAMTDGGLRRELRVLVVLGFVAALVVVLWFGLSEVYDAHFVDDSKRPALFLLVGIVAAFLLIRTNTRMIRAGVTWWPGNIEHGDIHVHHALFGLGGMVVAGLVEFVFRPPSPWVEFWALTFGAGMGLVARRVRALPAHRGRLLGGETAASRSTPSSWPSSSWRSWSSGSCRWGSARRRAALAGPRWVLIAIVAANLGLVVVTFLKGRLWLGVLGLVVPFIAWWGALRLARADSPWARRWYRARPDLHRPRPSAATRPSTSAGGGASTGSGT